MVFIRSYLILLDYYYAKGKNRTDHRIVNNLLWTRGVLHTEAFVLILFYICVCVCGLKTSASTTKRETRFIQTLMAAHKLL